MKDETLITLGGIFCLAAIMIVAILRGYDDFLVAGIIFIIAAAMGIMLPQPKFMK